MSGGKSWPRQRGEIDAYNAFLSAYPARNSDRGFSDEGYRLTNFFPTINNSFTETAVEPDFSLYDGETLILAEVKQGNNIEPRDVEQAKRLDSVSIDAAEEYIDKIDVDGRFGLSGNVFSTEPLVYYDDLDSDYVDDCRNKWEDCREQLEELEEYCPVLGREGEQTLQLLAGEFGSDHLQEWLTAGIEMAETPRVTVTMTDGLEIESIAVTICRFWGDRAVSEPVTVGVSELRTHFNYRDLEPGRVKSAFDLLDELGACDRVEKREIEFTPGHMPEILNIESLITDRSGDEDQESLDDFF
ncbi:hypothetical protein [Halobacterium sp. CBA1126]|uniref:hypothetical protein n=1 Tax=Halobacterium sp. CBA1126 TaxID=2668074 RepID=UPI0012F95CF3|nr:hypothetical protein [Halobacterium sp. CBA1126]MUV60010.1 hypothetical protein [Halobacterium sp. CBA1126]